MGQRSTTRSRQGGAVMLTYREVARKGRKSAAKVPKKRSRSGKIVTYKVGDEKPPLPSPPRSGPASSRREQ